LQSNLVLIKVGTVRILDFLRTRGQLAYPLFVSILDFKMFSVQHYTLHSI
jgi:hypothetical protein